MSVLESREMFLDERQCGYYLCTTGDFSSCQSLSVGGIHCDSGKTADRLPAVIRRLQKHGILSGKPEIPDFALNLCDFLFQLGQVWNGTGRVYTGDSEVKRGRLELICLFAVLATGHVHNILINEAGMDPLAPGLVGNLHKLNHAVSGLSIYDGAVQQRSCTGGHDKPVINQLQYTAVITPRVKHGCHTDWGKSAALLHFL